MPTYQIKYTEMQERLWVLNVEADTIEKAEALFESNNEDPWLMSTHEKCNWAWDSGDDGEATDTYETNWEIEEIE